MKPLIALLTVLACCSIASAGGIRKSLIGKWTAEVGEGATKSVTTIEFKENGEYTRVVTMGGKEFNPILGGKWQLTTDATGLKAMMADPNKLILTYQVMEALKLTNKTEAYIVIISKDATFGGKETLRLGPLDGSLIGTNYYFRAP